MTQPFNTFVTGLSSASALTGSELIPLVQGGTTVNTAASSFVTQTASSVSDSGIAASVNNYAPAGYTGGVTNRLIITPAQASTLTGLSATSVPDNFTIFIVNASTANSLTFSHLSGSSTTTNQFSNANAAPATLSPLGAARCTYVVNKWQFS